MTARVRLPGLEATRFFAASAIVLFHFVHLSKVEVPTSFGFIGTHFGMGVPLFYVVSAFGLSLGYHDKLGTREELKEYYLRRFLRIAPLFYFMMLFYIPYRGLLWGTYPSPAEFVSSGLFIFNFIPQHVQGFVAASWSIGVEMAFYFIFPLLLFVITNTRRAFAFFALTVLIKFFWVHAFTGASPVLRSFGNFFLVAHLDYFAAGILAFFVWTRIAGSRETTRLGTIIIVTALALMLGLYARQTVLTIGPVIGWDNTAFAIKIAWGLALATFVIGVSMSPVRVLVNDVTQTLGKASFSIYLWHPVVITVLITTGAYAAIYGALGSGTPAFLLCSLLTFLLVYPLSLASYRWIEAPGMRLIQHFSPAPMGSIAAVRPAG